MDLEAFDRLGFARVPGAFSRAAAAAMEATVWERLEHGWGMRRDQPDTWSVTTPTGLQSLKRHGVFEPIGGEVTCAAIDAVVGEDRWKRPAEWGQFLVSFPNAELWSVPSGIWHTDFGYVHAGDRPFGAVVFSFLSDVPAAAGGTLVVAGSHQLIARFLESNPRRRRERMKHVRKAFLASEPWLAALASEADDDPDRSARLMQHEHEIDGVPVRVVELSGEAGDVIVVHPWLLHASSPNAGRAPRLMRVQRIHLAPESPA